MKALLSRLAFAVSEWLFNPKCPFCSQRDRNLERHFYLDHEGDEVTR